MLYSKSRFVTLLLACILWLMILPATGKNGDEVIIGEPEVGQLFAAQYGCYQTGPAGSISLQNITHDDLFADVRTAVGEYTSSPLTVAARLPAGETTQVPLRIDFNFDKLPTRGQPLALEAEIEIRISSENEELCSKRRTAKFELYNLHRLPDESPEAIAVFIDAKDPSLAIATHRGVLLQVEAPDSTGQASTAQLRDSSKTAQRLFELMKGEEIMCMRQADQRVQYPRQLLYTKIGSSYDCALLYAALLEHAGVPVALMVSDDYILILLQGQGGQIEGREQTEFVSWKGERWIPVDIRMLKATFPEARTAGVEAYENLKRAGKVKPFILRDAWEQYKPVRFVSSQSVKGIELGLLYFERGEWDKAEEIFKKHLNGDASAAAYNNLGNLYLLNAKYETAMSHYLKALETDPDDGAIYLNIGIGYVVTGEDRDDAMFDRAYNKLGSYRQMCYGAHRLVRGGVE